MKLKSVSGLACHVKNLKKTAKFYETLGFEVRKQEADHITVYSNWFWIDFLSMDQAERPGYGIDNIENKGSGILIYLSVDDVDEFYKELQSNGIKPATVPANQPWGNREFILRDLDGYKLVIFKRK